MKVVIPGGTGQVGTILARAFHSTGHDIVVVGRATRPSPWRTINWDAKTIGAWAEELSGADAVVNLAGHTVNCRYTPKNRRLIMQSRVDTTRLVGSAIAAASPPPAVWLQASTATIYAHRFDANNDDLTGRLGGDEPDAPPTWRFSIEVATAWERALNEAETHNTRKVLMRSAMIMSPDRGGIFDVILRLVRFGLGGPVAGGRQYVSWIHDQDFSRAVLWLIEHQNLEGPVNLASPNPLPYSQFVRALRKAWGIPFGLPATKWMLEIGAIPLQIETELILKSRRVVPRRLIDSGFAFQFPQWKEAASDLCTRWRSVR